MYKSEFHISKMDCPSGAIVFIIVVQGALWILKLGK